MRIGIAGRPKLVSGETLVNAANHLVYVRLALSLQNGVDTVQVCGDQRAAATSLAAYSAGEASSPARRAWRRGAWTPIAVTSAANSMKPASV